MRLFSEEKRLTKVVNIWIFSFLCVLGVMFMTKAPFISTQAEANQEDMIIQILLTIIGGILVTFSLIFALWTWWVRRRLQEQKTALMSQYKDTSFELRIMQEMQKRKRKQLNIQCHFQRQAQPERLDYRIYDMRKE